MNVGVGVPFEGLDTEVALVVEQDEVLRVAGQVLSVRDVACVFSRNDFEVPGVVVRAEQIDDIL